MPRMCRSILLSLGALAVAACAHEAGRGHAATSSPVSGDRAPQLCMGDARAWVREAERTVDFEARFYDFDDHLRRYAGGFEPFEGPRAHSEAERDARLHAQAMEAFSRLLPFITNDNGDPDMSEFADRIHFGEIDIPEARDTETVMRIAFAYELLEAYPDAGKRITSFMSDFDMARNLIAINRNGVATPSERDALREMPRIVLETYTEDLQPVFEKTLFGAWHTDLSSRLAGRVSRLCAERALALEIEAKSMTKSEEPGHE